MRIVQVNDLYSLVGGSEKTLRRSSEGLAAAGHEVLVIHGEEAARNQDGSRYLPSLARATLFRAGRARAELLAALDGYRPDIVHFRNFDAATVIAAVAGRYAAVRTVHTPWTYCPCGLKYGAATRLTCVVPFGVRCLAVSRRIKCHLRADGPAIGAAELGRRILACYAFRAVDRRLGAVVVTSRWMKDMLTAAGQRPGRIHVVPPPVDMPPDAAPVNGRPAEIVAVGRLAPGKGFEDLIAAVKLLPGAKLVVVGDGPARPELQALADAAGLNGRMEFTGWVPYAELGDIYRRARVVALPSLGPEAFGNVGVEALSHGRPVVGYDVGGVSEWLVDGRVGFLARPRDPADLAAKLNRLLENPDLATRMGAAGRARAAAFSLTRHVEKTLAVYEVAIGRKKRDHRKWTSP